MSTQTKQSNKQRVYIFDTTLRDGQQSPGAGMNFEDNIAYADYAHALNIDALEAGFLRQVNWISKLCIRFLSVWQIENLI